MLNRTLPTVHAKICELLIKLDVLILLQISESFTKLSETVLTMEIIMCMLTLITDK